MNISRVQMPVEQQIPFCTELPEHWSCVKGSNKYFVSSEFLHSSDFLLLISSWNFTKQKLAHWQWTVSISDTLAILLLKSLQEQQTWESFQEQRQLPLSGSATCSWEEHESICSQPFSPVKTHF